MFVANTVDIIAIFLLLASRDLVVGITVEKIVLPNSSQIQEHFYSSAVRLWTDAIINKIQ
jgi:hypothetical protein